MEFNITNTGSAKYTLKAMSGAFVSPQNASQVTRKVSHIRYLHDSVRASVLELF